MWNFKKGNLNMYMTYLIQTILEYTSIFQTEVFWGFELNCPYYLVSAVIPLCVTLSHFLHCTRCTIIILTWTNHLLLPSLYSVRSYVLTNMMKFTIYALQYAISYIYVFIIETNATYVGRPVYIYVVNSIEIIRR